MNKQEIIQLHSGFAQLKDQLESMDQVDSEQFSVYNELGVSPEQTHQSKVNHKKAVFALGECFSAIFSEDEFSDSGRLRKRMAELREDLD